MWIHVTSYGGDHSLSLLGHVLQNLHVLVCLGISVNEAHVWSEQDFFDHHFGALIKGNVLRQKRRWIVGIRKTVTADGTERISGTFFTFSRDFLLFETEITSLKKKSID